VLELTDTSSRDRDHVEYGLEMDGYDSTAATDLVLSQPDLNVTGLSGASSAGQTGDFSANVWRATLFTSPLAVCSTGTQTHQGKRRVRARFHSSVPDGDKVYARLAWRVSDGPWERNGWVSVVANKHSEPSLGSIYVPLGETWEGRIEAKATSNATATIDVDVIFPMPAERWGVSRRLVKEQTTSVLSGYDTFLHAAGDLTGKVMPLGGTWAEAGDAVGLVLDTANDWVTRTEVSDGAALTNGHFALAGATDYTATSVEVAANTNTFDNAHKLGVVARYVDSSNFVVAYFQPTTTNHAAIYAYKVIAGAATMLGGVDAYGFYADRWRKIRLEVDAVGQWSVAVSTSLPVESNGDFGTFYQVLSGQDSAVDALAAGQAGIFDHNTTATASFRGYDEFMLSAPPAGETLGAMFSGQSMRFSHDRAERENSAGTRWGAAPNFIGQHLLIPPAGRGDRTSRIAVLSRRYDIDGGQPSDGLSDAMTATLTVTPRVLLLPE
jgi:ligand-binding SRPBCC domain-containing protein